SVTCCVKRVCAGASVWFSLFPLTVSFSMPPPRPMAVGDPHRVSWMALVFLPALRTISGRKHQKILGEHTDTNLDDACAAAQRFDVFDRLLDRQERLGRPKPRVGVV